MGAIRYLDYAATTPVLAEVQEVMSEAQGRLFGNPSSVYALGRESKTALEEAREQVAAAVGGLPGEIVFTGGGTEADNMALKGVAFKRRPRGGHIVISAVEHHAVLHTADWLRRQGFRVTVARVTPEGIVDLDALSDALDDETILVSLMLVNNELGTIQPVGEAARLVKERCRALFHTDAVQGLGKIEVNLEDLGVDLASFAAHKIGGPKGVGALWVRRRTPVEEILHGGGQERGLRSGTPNVAGIAGFGVAASLASAQVVPEGQRLGGLRDRLQRAILSAIPGVRVNGGGAPRIPGTLNVCIEGIEGESMLLMLDRAGIAASSGSACTSGSLDPSHVLLALGVPRQLALGALRFSLGSGSTPEDVDAVLECLPPIVEKLRAGAPRAAGALR